MIASPSSRTGVTNKTGISSSSRFSTRENTHLEVRVQNVAVRIAIVIEDKVISATEKYARNAGE